MHWTVYLMFAVYLVSVTVVGGREETVLKWRWTKSRNVQQCLNGCGWLSHGGWRPLWFHEWFQWLPRKIWFTATPSGHRTDLHMLANNQHWLQSVSQSSSIVCIPSKEHISIIHVPTLQHMFLWMTVFVYIWTGWGHRNLMSNVILRKSRLDKTFKT